MTKGVLIGCDGGNVIRLIFDDSIPHKQTDDLVRTIRGMGLVEVIVQNGY